MNPQFQQNTGLNDKINARTCQKFRILACFDRLMEFLLNIDDVLVGHVAEVA